LQGGDKIPRKGGPPQSKGCWAQIDIAEYVNASLDVMQRDALLMRGDGPTVFTSVKLDKGVDDVVDLILAAWKGAGKPGVPGAVQMSEV